MKGKKGKSKRRQTKQRIKSEEDRISLLPDCLLVDIITHLPETKEAIRTGILSKRWRFLWPQVPNLIFIYKYQFDCRDGSYDKKIANFFLFVEKTLTQRGQSNIHKFKLHCSYSHETETQLNNCICYAISNNVREFDIKVWYYSCDCDQVILPQTLFTSSSFVHLRLAEYNFYNPETSVISWKNLRTLRLKKLEFGDGLIQNILSGSPLLETLELADCHGPKRLDITNKSVKNLVLSFGFQEGDHLDSFKVNAPYILSLTIQKSSTLKKLLLLNVSSVIKAELNYFNLANDESDSDHESDSDDESDSNDEHPEPFEEMLRGLILSLGHVKEIKIGKLCFKALALLKAKDFIYPSNLKILEDVDSN